MRFIVIFLIVMALISCKQDKKDKSNTIDIQTKAQETKIQTEQIAENDTNNVIVFPSFDYLKPKSDIEILICGDFHENEVSKNAIDKKWWGLFKANNGTYSINETKPIIKNVIDPILDEDESNPTGINIKIDHKDSLILLISGVDRLKNSKIKSISDYPSEILPDDTLEFTFNKIEYKLFASGKKESFDNQWFVTRNYQLYLETKIKNDKTLISSFPYFDDSMIQILFIGDIDLDGKIDLIIDNSPKYNSFNPTLYLSSYAEEKELVKIVGMGSFTGC